MNQAGIHRRYVRELRRETGYLSAWLPTVSVAVGDVGELYRDRFEPRSTLARLGLGFETKAGSPPAVIDYCSRGDVGISTGAGVGENAVRVSFAAEYGVVFQAEGCRSREIQDLERLGAEILALRRAGRWPRRRVVVTEVVHSGATVILVSNQRDAHVELSASGAVAPGAWLPGAAANLETTSSHGVGVKVIAPEGLTPLFRVFGIRRRLTGSTGAGFRAGLPVVEADGLCFTELGYDDVEDEDAEDTVDAGAAEDVFER